MICHITLLDPYRAYRGMQMGYFSMHNHSNIAAFACSIQRIRLVLYFKALDIGLTVFCINRSRNTKWICENDSNI